MKPARAFVYASAVVVLALPLLALPSAPVHSFPFGAPAFFSGPEQYCNYCHGTPDTNPVNSGTGSVVIDAPLTFAPGEAIPVTVTVHNTTPQVGPEQRQGFELSTRITDDPNLAYVGSYNVDAIHVQISPGAPSDDWVTHTAMSNTDTTWTFEWVAPETDVPERVTFYAAGNASNSDGINNDLDEIYSDSLVLTRIDVANEPDAPSRAFRLDAPYPNPVRTTATVRYTLYRPSPVEVRLLDGRGRLVRMLEAGDRGAGAHALALAADGLPAGTYFLTVSTPEVTQVRSVTVAR